MLCMTSALLAGCNAEGVRTGAGETAPGMAWDLASSEVLIAPGPPPADAGMPSDATLLAEIRQRAARQRAASSRLRLDDGAPRYDDLWERLRAGMQFTSVDHERVRKEVAWYSKRPEYLRRVTDRARLYLAYIVDEVEQRGLPTELALLPVVESAFQPYARSPAGAMGMWQFIGPTGTRFGLRRSPWYDARRDVLESTRAALDYLSYLYELLEQDWLLAVAGYNAGEGNVRRALRRARSASSATDFFSLSLPAETEAYVPRLLAIVELVTHPDRYGLTLDPIDGAPYFEVVETPGQIDLSKAAELAGISLNELMLLNAGFMRHASDPAGPHRLLLPVESAPAFSDALSRQPQRLALDHRRHTVASGEDLAQIARRYATTAANLRDANGLAGDRLAVGQVLTVPAGFDSAMVASLSREVREGMRRARGNEQRSVYRVRGGDSLWLIARRHDTTVAKLKQWNRIGRRNLVKPGQRLVIWTPPKARRAPRNASTPATRRGGIVHVVERGDNLWTIARRYGITTDRLRQLNNLQRKTLIKPGQTLRVARADSSTDTA
jgi:membrane-bound lytic murein transglycosylase D